MKYILLLSGGISSKWNYTRYGNDLAYAYTVLTKQWNTSECVFEILYADGTPIAYLNHSLKTKSAVKQNVMQVLSDWRKLVDVDDELYVIISNHGDNDSSNTGSICLWGNEWLKIDEFVAVTNDFPCFKYFVWGQCYAGNVLNLELHNTLVITANEAGKESYAKIDKIEIFDGGKQFQCEFDEFLYQFFSALNGAYPSGTPLAECRGKCHSIEDAYEYARKHDAWNPDSPVYESLCQQIKTDEIREIPQMRYFA